MKQLKCMSIDVMANEIFGCKIGIFMRLQDKRSLNIHTHEIIDLPQDTICKVYGEFGVYHYEKSGVKL